MIDDYSVYEFSKKELLVVILRGMAICLVIGFLFYRSIFGSILISPYIYFYINNQKNQKMRHRKQRLSIGFRDGIRCVLAALEAGYSMENAISEAVKDLCLMYDENAEIVKDFNYIHRQIKNNISIEEAMEQFALRTGIEDIESFSEVLQTAKRTGGDIIKIIRSTSNAISEKLEVRREIITLITEKQLEVTILKMIPFGIIIYLWLTSPGFLSPLYYNVFGILFMSIVLILYVIISKIASRITNIEV